MSYGIVLNVPSFDRPTGDPNGLAYGAILENTDGVSLGGNYTAESNLFAGLKQDGIYSKVKAAFLFGHGTQASCRREIISLAQGTIPTGTVTALAGRVSFTASGCVGFPSNANTYVTTNSQAMALDFYDLVAPAVGYDFGARDTTPHFCLYRYAFASGISAGLGDFGKIQTPNSEVTADMVYMMSRTSASDGGHYTWNGTAFNTIATSAALSGGSIPALPPYVGCLNAEGSAAAPTNGRYRSCWIFDGMSIAELQLFCNRYQTYKVTKGWT